MVSPLFESHLASATGITQMRLVYLLGDPQDREDLKEPLFCLLFETESNGVIQFIPPKAVPSILS